MTMTATDRQESTLFIILDLQKQIDDLTAELEAQKDIFKSTMEEADADTVKTAGGFTVTWKEVTASRLDSKALKEALPKVYETFSKASTCRRFVIR